MLADTDAYTPINSENSGLMSMAFKFSYLSIFLSLLVYAPGSHALPPNTPEPGDKDSYAMCAAASEVSLHFIARDLPLRANGSEEKENLRDLMDYHKDQRRRFRNMLRDETSRKEADAMIDAEKVNVLEALKTQEVEGDVLATDNLRKRKLDEWYSDFCRAKMSEA